MPDESARREAQESRARYMNDPANQQPTDTAESVQADADLSDEEIARLDALAQAEVADYIPDPEDYEPPQSTVLAAFVEGGIEFRIFVPMEAVAIELPEEPAPSYPDDAASGAEDPIN